MSKVKLKVKKGDKVKVISGDSKGQIGQVMQVNVSEGTVIVQGVNLVSKHKKPTAQNTQGSIEKVEAPLRICKVMVVSPISGKATRIGRRLNDKGVLVRFAKQTKEKEEIA